MGSPRPIGAGIVAARVAVMLLVAGCATVPPSTERREGVATPGPAAAERSPPRASEPVAARPVAPPDDVLPRPIAGTVEFVMASRQIPGCIVALFTADGLRVQCFGWRDPEKRIPMTRDTLFPIGSITRSITVSAIATLVDEGKVGWESTLAEALPADFALPEPVRAITLRQLATHTSGLPGLPANWSIADADLASSTRYGLRELIEALQTVDLVAAPSTFFLYSSFGSALLGVALERASGLRYGEAIEQLCFRRLGMHDSFIEPTLAQADRLTRGWSWSDGKRLSSPRFSLGEFASVGGVCSSVDDLVKFMTVHGGEGGPWSAEVVADMRQPVAPVLGTRGREVATGWYLETLPRFGPLLASAGEFDGVSSAVAADLDSASFLVVLANAGDRAAEKVARALLEKLDDRDGVWHY